MTRAKADIEAQRKDRRRQVRREFISETLTDLRCGADIALTIYFASHASSTARAGSWMGVFYILASIVFAAMAIGSLERRSERRKRRATWS